MRCLCLALALLMSPAALAAEPATPKKLEVEGPRPIPPSVTQEVAAQELKVQASSSLCEGKGAKRKCHGPENLIDGESATAWCEGAKADGEGESVTLELASPQEVAWVEVVPYYAKDMRRASNNARPQEMLLEVGTQRFTLTFPDYVTTVFENHPEEGTDTSEGPCGDETCEVSRDDVIRAGHSFAVKLPEPVKAQKVRLEVRSTYGGEKFSDTCMSEVKLRVRKAAPAKPQ